MANTAVKALTWVFFAVSLSYAAGLSFVLLSMLSIAGVPLPPDGTLFWKIAFPITTLTKPDLKFQEMLEADANGVVDVTALPFMKEGIAFFPLSIFAEIFLGFARGKVYHRFDDTLTSLMTGLVNRMVTLLAHAWMAIPYGYIWTNFRLVDTPDTISTFFIALLGVDLLYYAYHRTTHEMGLFWNSHSVHHSSNEYNLPCALRQTMTPFDSVLFYLPLALAVPPRVKAVHGAFSLLYQYWVHTRHVPKLWWPIEYVMSTPSHHRVHHARNPAYAAGGGRNYGGIFIIWDRMFGTFAEERVGAGYAMPKDLGMVRKLEDATGEPFETQDGLSSDLVAAAKAGERSGVQAEGQKGGLEEAEPPVYGLIPPLTSNEALHAQSYHWYDMFKRMVQAPSFRDALVVPYASVGWYLVKQTPRVREAWERSEKEAADGKQDDAVPPAGRAVDKPSFASTFAESGKPRHEQQKVWKDIPVPSLGTRYNPVLQQTAPLGWALVLHCTVHFAMITGAFYASEQVAAMTSGPARTVTLVLFVISGMFGVGSLLDRRTFAAWYEAIRCLVVSAALVAVHLALVSYSADGSVSGGAAPSQSSGGQDGPGLEEAGSVGEVVGIASRAAEALFSHADGPLGAIADAYSAMGTLSRVLLGVHLGSVVFALGVLPGAAWAAKQREEERLAAAAAAKKARLAASKKEDAPAAGQSKSKQASSRVLPSAPIHGVTESESKAAEGLRHRPTATVSN